MGGLPRSQPAEAREGHKLTRGLAAPTFLVKGDVTKEPRLARPSRDGPTR